MLTLVTLKDYFKATAKIVEITSFKSDWVSSINEDVDLDCMVYPVPEFDFENKNYDYYDIKFYIFDLDKDYNEDEKFQKWHELSIKAKAFVSKILENKKDFAKIGRVSIKPNEDSIGNDDLLWVECNFKLRVLNCGEPTPIPVP